MGRIEKIFCGQEQCWPAEDEDDVLHIIIKDNPVDQNVLEVHKYTSGDFWRLECVDTWYPTGENLRYLMYVEPYQEYPG